MTRTRHYIRLLACLAIFMTGAALPAQAQTIIRDTEIETYMGEWFAPIFKAAGMQPEQVKIIIVQDPDINAFVAGGANIFINTGLIQKTENPGELIGVMAHELGHITGGHIIRAREAMDHASYESILGLLVGIGAAVATGDSAAASAIGAGGTSMAQRKFLATARTYEASADQHALSALEKAHINPTGLLTFLKKLEGQEMLPSSQQSEYVQTHPLTRSRIDAVNAAVEKSAYRDTPYPAEWTEQHARMKAKLIAFLTPEQVVWHYDDRDTSIAALSARAIAAYRLNHVDESLKLADQLIAREPKNPYFQELKGQMLFDFGRIAESIPPYEKALSLIPKAGLIRTALAHAQLESAGNDRARLQSAQKNLWLALETEPRSTRIYRLLATTEGRLGNEPAARLYLGEEALLQRNFTYARQQAEVALKGLKPGSPEWLRAKDLLNAIDQEKKRANSED